MGLSDSNSSDFASLHCHRAGTQSAGEGTGAPQTGVKPSTAAQQAARIHIYNNVAQARTFCTGGVHFSFRAV